MPNSSTNSVKKRFLTQSLLATVSTLALTACGGGGGGSTATTPPVQQTPPPVSTNPVATTATPEMAALALLNQNRSVCGFGTLTTDTSLTNTAINHANYLKAVSESNLTNFASHDEKIETGFVNTGSSNPYFSGLAVADRLNPTTLGSGAIKTNYDYVSVGENISLSLHGTGSTTEQVDKNATAEKMLTGLFAAPYHIRTLVAPTFTQVGMSYREAKWTTAPYYYTYSILEAVAARPQTAGNFSNTQLLNYPCEGSVTAEKLTHELPNPIPGRDLEKFPIGQSVYVLAPAGKTISQASATITTKGVTIGTIHVLTQATDPNHVLQANEAIFVPDQPLGLNTTYTVSYNLLYSDGTTGAKSFNFTTQATSTL